MKKVSSSIFIVFIALYFSGCTSFTYKKANLEFDNLEYYFAIKDYKKVLNKKEDHQGAKIKLANSYRLTNDFENADSLYAIIVEYPEIDSIEYFNYAKVLMSKGDYENTKKWCKKYLEKVPDDMAAQLLLASCDSLGAFMRDTTLFTLNGVNFTEFTSFYGGVPYKNGFVFMADKKEVKNSKKNPWTGNSYLDLYYVEKGEDGNWTTPALLEGKINGKYHEGPASFTKSGDVVYFTRSDYNRNTLQANDADVSMLKMFKAKLIEGRWEQLEEMPFNGDNYSVGHPFICEDEKTIYFISNMPGGFGGTDIYRSYFDGEKWGPAENLGESINTSGNEMFPSMAPDGTLYFSSTSHTNMGGLDVFSSTYDKKKNKWSKVENLLFPLNSSKDDYGMVLSVDGKNGYVSSNRDGSDKIYQIEKHDPTFFVLGNAKYKGFGTPVVGAMVEVLDEKTNTKLSALTDAEGNYKIRLESNANYAMLCSKEACFKLSDNVSTKKKKYSENFTVNFELDSIIVEKPIVVENIYYDYDKWRIRSDAKDELDKLVLLLKDNANLSIEMSSHCDARGSDEYNLKLSEKRAKAAVKYLVSQKIDQSRLTWKGYGETQLLNKCGNDVECSDEEHQKNRRTEFKVTKIEKEPDPKATITEVK